MVGTLIDTNVWIDILRCFGRDNSKYLYYVLENHEHIYISDITISELWAGSSMDDKENILDLGSIISGCRLLYPDQAVLFKTGEILREYDLTFPDARIAATAIVGGVELLTLDRKGFNQIDGLKLARADLG